MSKVCGDCWADIRPDQYEPFTFIAGVCHVCMQIGNVHRVSKAEVEAQRARNAVKRAYEDGYAEANRLD